MHRRNFLPATAGSLGVPAFAARTETGVTDDAILLGPAVSQVTPDPWDAAGADANLAGRSTVELVRVRPGGKHVR